MRPGDRGRQHFLALIKDAVGPDYAARFDAPGFLAMLDALPFANPETFPPLGDPEIRAALLAWLVEGAQMALARPRP